MSASLTALIGIVSGAIGVIATLVTIRVQMRKDAREQGAADDVEADRVIKLKDERIDELEQKVDRLQLDIDALAAKVRLLERRIDQYGCWNAPHCDNRKPLSGPNPHGDI